MYRHFRLTPYTNHYKYSAFQDSRLEFVSLFPRVDTRLIPTNVLHATYLRYLHIIYMLHTILKHTTNISCKSTPLHHNIPYTQHTKHTPSSSIHFFIYYYYYYYIIIIYLFFLPSFIIIIIILLHWPTHKQHSHTNIPPSPAHKTPNTLTTLHLCSNNLYHTPFIRKHHVVSMKYVHTSIHPILQPQLSHQRSIKVQIASYQRTCFLLY